MCSRFVARRWMKLTSAPGRESVTLTVLWIMQSRRQDLSINWLGRFKTNYKALMIFFFGRAVDRLSFRWGNRWPEIKLKMKSKIRKCSLEKIQNNNGTWKYFQNFYVRFSCRITYRHISVHKLYAKWPILCNWTAIFRTLREQKRNRALFRIENVTDRHCISAYNPAICIFNENCESI